MGIFYLLLLCSFLSFFFELSVGDRNVEYPSLSSNILMYDICNSFVRSVYIVYTVLGDVSVYVVGKDEYDELACKCMAPFL